MRNAKIINGDVQRQPLRQIVPHPDYVRNVHRQLLSMPTTSTPKCSKKVYLSLLYISVNIDQSVATTVPTWHGLPQEK